METPYREAARRRARKEQALKAGEEHQKELDELRKRSEELRARRAAAEARRRQAAAGSHPARPKRPAGANGSARPAGAAGSGSAGSAGSAAPAKPGQSKSFADPRVADTTKLCPHCQTKLVRVVCLQKPVLACVQCRGISLSGDVVKQFAAQGGWFGQLDAAVSHFVRRLRPH